MLIIKGKKPPGIIAGDAIITPAESMPVYDGTSKGYSVVTEATDDDNWLDCGGREEAENRLLDY